MAGSIIQSDNTAVISQNPFTHTYFEAMYGMPNVQGGHALVVFVGGAGSTPGAGVASITDNYGNSYTQVPGAYIQNENDSAFWQDVWWAQNVAQVTDPDKSLALTFTLQSGAGAAGVIIVECSGINGAELVVGGNGAARSGSADLDGPSIDGGSGAVYLASLCSQFAASGDMDNSVHASVNSPWSFPALSGTGEGGGGFSWSGNGGPCLAGLVSTGAQQPIFNSTAVFGTFDGGVISAVAFVGGSTGDNSDGTGDFDAAIYQIIDALSPALASATRQIVHDCCVGYFLTHGSSGQIPEGWDGTTAPDVSVIVALTRSLVGGNLEPPGA